ncbi:hypothetical protein PRUPE_4G206700 [Prunus persica]|uniref:Protein DETOXIFICATION n=1 Tax=Prunus persica TaxID=3760 RepID=A0A251PNM5_PRUPE|nr:hypothetical protein PRUPE_4G206700 [Prunus persica]
MEAGGHGNQQGRKGGWWNKLLDMEEAKNQVLFFLPMILTNVCYYTIPLISVMFAGHLGELELAGATFANSWATITGFALMVGLSGALETLCGQGLEQIWFYTEPILILLHQDPQISKSAALYMKFLIPRLFAYGFMHNILRFLQTQSVVMPLVFFSLIPVVIHICVAYALVHWTALGFKGAPLACSISIWIAMLMLAMYVIFAKKFELTWEGFSLESFHYYRAFEILVVLAGLMPNAEQTTSLIAMCVNTEAIAYMITYGLSAAASTRVSNELGAGNPDKAKKAMAVTLKLSVLLGLLVVLALAFGHNIWASLFSDSSAIIKLFASMTPFLGISIMADSVQGVLSGVARGCGFQHLAMYVNLGTFYLVGMTVACVVGFKLKLYAKGLWIGLICGLCCQAALLLLVTLRTKWTQLDVPHNGDAVLVKVGQK